MIKKNRLRSKIFFEILLATYLFFQFWQTRHHLTTKDVIVFVIMVIILFFIGELAERWMMKLMMKSRSVTQSAVLDTAADEIILFQTPASHLKGIESVGGHLFLTNKRLVFQSHNITFQKHKLSIGLPDITKIEKYKRSGMNTGLIVTTINNTNEKFVVENADEWISEVIRKNKLHTEHSR
jgi:hypothetical protein